MVVLLGVAAVLSFSGGRPFWRCSSSLQTAPARPASGGRSSHPPDRSHWGKLPLESREDWDLIGNDPGVVIRRQPTEKLANSPSQIPIRGGNTIGDMTPAAIVNQV